MADPTDDPTAEPPDPDLDAPADPSEPPAGPGGPPRWQMIVAGLVVGVLIGGGLAWWSNRDSGEDSASTTDSTLAGLDDRGESPEAADAFVDAWERSRTTTYLSGSLFSRSLPNNASLELPIVVAQRPPDRVVSTGGSVQGSVGGVDQVCDEQLDGLIRCAPTTDAAAAEADLQRELDTLRSYFEGDLPIYRVSQSGDCFDLRLTSAIQAPPYGQNARFCFDAASGAPSLQRIERVEGVDEVTLVSVRTDVTDEDIAKVSSGEIDEELLAG